MMRVHVVSDLDECRQLWRSVICEEQISDLWEVRNCFHKQYRHQPHFVVAEENGEILGLLPLSLNLEAGCYHYFPGETWEGKTWLEQNRLVVNDPSVLSAMLEYVPGPFHLRYLKPSTTLAQVGEVVDEIGYYFLPPMYDYRMENYLEAFSHKSAKRLQKELSAWDDLGLTFVYDRLEDFEALVAMNVSRYGADSYFFDTRFLRSFRSLVNYLEGRDWLRTTTVMVDRRPAAIDVGCVYNGTYTLLAGGTHADFPGIAKVINTHHMKRACNERLDRVDFLCGDFNWKRLFHLTEQPLYLLAGDAQVQRQARVDTPIVWRSVAGHASGSQLHA